MLIIAWMLSVFSAITIQIGHSTASLKTKLTQGFVCAVDFVNEDANKVIGHPC